MFSLNICNGVYCVQEIFKHCTEGRALVGNVGDRHTVGLDDLGGIFQPW